MEEKGLTRAAFTAYLNRFTGENNFGDAKAVGSYQLFTAEEDVNSADRQKIYKINRAVYTLRYSKTHPNFIALDIRFNSCDDTELKILWSRLRKYEENTMSDHDNTWIFHITLLESASFKADTDENDAILLAHLVNPIMCYLTRETPTQLAEDHVVNGEKLGGNVVRMLFTTDYVSLEQSDMYDTPEIKAEIMRDEEASQYIDNYEPPMSDDDVYT